MRFPRTKKMFRGQLDAAPFAGVFFLLVIFLALNSSLVFTPGVPIRLPMADDLPGTDSATVVVAIDAGGQLFFENPATDEKRLQQRLTDEVKSSREPLTLVVQADKDVKHETLVRVSLLARQAGFKDAPLATRPPVAAAGGKIFTP